MDKFIFSLVAGILVGILLALVTCKANQMIAEQAAERRNADEIRTEKRREEAAGRSAREKIMSHARAEWKALLPFFDGIRSIRTRTREPGELSALLVPTRTNFIAAFDRVFPGDSAQQIDFRLRELTHIFFQQMMAAYKPDSPPEALEAAWSSWQEIDKRLELTLSPNF